MPLANLLSLLDTGDRRALVRAGLLATSPLLEQIARTVFSRPDSGREREAAALLSRVAVEAPHAWQELALSAMQVLEVLPVEEAGHLWRALASMAARSPSAARSLMELFVERAQVGDAKLGTELVLTVLDADRMLPPWADLIIAWFIEHGGAEARRTDEPRVALAMLKLIEGAHLRTSELLPPLLRLAAGSRSPENLLTVNGEGDRVLWAALERGLEAGLAAEHAVAFVQAAMAAIDTLGHARFLVALHPSTGLPRLRDVMLRAFSTSERTGPVQEGVWLSIMQQPPSPEMHPMTHPALHTALAALARSRAAPPREDGAWAEVLANAWFARFGLDRDTLGPPFGGARLDVLAGDARLAPGIARALDRALGSSPPEAHRSARRCMAESVDDPRIASVALLVVDATGESLAKTHGLTVSDIASALEAVLSSERARGCSQGAGRVVLTDGLDRDFAVSILGEVVCTGPLANYLGVCAAASNAADALSLCQLYFAHELVHIRQGVQRKSVVTQLRTAASESLLLELDLAADDSAARIVAEVSGGRTLLDLKALQVRGAAAFPAGVHHTVDATFRKARRLVSQMADCEIRRQGAFNKGSDAPGYGVVEMSGVMGPLVMTWTDGAPCVLATAQITSAEAELLSRAAFAGVNADDVRSLVADLVSRAVPVG